MTAIEWEHEEGGCQEGGNVNPEAARALACTVMAQEGYVGEPTRVLDTRYPDQFPAWRITRGLVVYEDDPDCLVSLDDSPGRFVTA